MTREELLSLSEQYGTPLYVYDAAAFRRRAEQVRQALGPSTGLCYSIKANSFLLACLPEEIQALEVCSPGELEICMKLGVDPTTIIFSGVNKTEDSVRRALDCGAGILTAESPEQFFMIDRLSRERGIVSHVLPRLTAGDQFGMPETALRQLVRDREAYPGAELEGIHFFSGTQKSKPKKIVRELERLTVLAEDLAAQYGWRPRRLEYGTGLFADYFGADPDASELQLLSEVGPALRQAAETFALTVEMGRFLASPCGTYLTKVHELKPGDETCFVILDGGNHQLHYDGQVMGMRQPPMQVLNDSTETQHYTLCGSLCSTGDCLAQNAELPRLSCGDVIAFQRVGAYSNMEAMALFLSRELPPVVLWDGRESRLLRPRIETAFLNCPETRTNS